MKQLLITTIAAVLLVGCGESQLPEQPTAKAPDISIHEAAALGNIEVVKQFLDSGTDVNAKDETGGTPLDEAAGWGRKDVVELLIAKGADVNAKMVSGAKKGNTPLDDANETGNTETADLLRKHGGKTAKELRAEGK